MVEPHQPVINTSSTPEPQTLPARAWQQLSRTMTGPLHHPGDERFEELARPATNRHAAPRPQAIARCATPTDVLQVINFAQRHGLETAVRGAGHSFTDHSSTAGLLIETGLMNAVVTHGDLATIGAGARLAEIYGALHNRRATIPAGCGPTVGIAGLALGGGLGVLGRTYGLTCDSLAAAQIVLADGTLITCDEASEPDLYWALRGAGAGNFGVVTALTFRTISEPYAVAFHLSWPGQSASAALIAWLEWAPQTPDAMAASLVVRAPADPSVRPQANLIGAMIADGPVVAGALNHFEQLVGDAERRRQFPPAPISDVKARLADVGAEVGDGTSTAVEHSASEFYGEPLPASIASSLADALTTDRIPGQARELALTPMGGAYNRVSADATAFVHRGDQFLLEWTATSDPAQPGASHHAASRWLGDIRTLRDGHGTGRTYQNFPDPELAEPLLAYYGENLPRLRHIKDRYDPGNLFHHRQSIPPTTQRHATG